MGRKELKAFIGKKSGIRREKVDASVCECVAQEKKRQFVNNLLARSQSKLEQPKGPSHAKVENELCDSDSEGEARSRRDNPAIDDQRNRWKARAHTREEGIRPTVPGPSDKHVMSHDNVIENNINPNSASHETDGRKWIDDKHEEDGRQPEYIETNFDEQNQFSGYDVQAVVGEHPYFKTGINSGAKMLRDEMMAPTQVHGGWVAYGDVSGEEL